MILRKNNYSVANTRAYFVFSYTNLYQVEKYTWYTPKSRVKCEIKTHDDDDRATWLISVNRSIAKTSLIARWTAAVHIWPWFSAFAVAPSPQLHLSLKRIENPRTLTRSDPPMQHCMHALQYVSTCEYESSAEYSSSTRTRHKCNCNYRFNPCCQFECIAILLAASVTVRAALSENTCKQT